ncbi:6054_t:CDS:2 [Dentiscutata erythropus]|uniref:6054_t:CDS:1 n=1 Tax=Dentiscutata erythropus TaxID=1348616 RepID=A0A9N9H5Y4_9GLOM|nr:6054_t:CDS:2 [Dentiscutata erythropus]
MAQRCEHREWLDNAIRNNQIIKYDYNTFNNITPIGQGAFRKVFSAISSKVKSKVALKSIKINPDFTIELLVNELKQHVRIEIEIDDYVNNSQPDIINIIQGLTNGIDADSEIFHELYEVLSSTSNSTTKALNLTSNINEISISPSNFDDSKTLEYIDNNIKDPDKQFLQQLVQLFFNHINISEEPKSLVNKIEGLIKDYNENSDKVFKKLLKHQGQPTFFTTMELVLRLTNEKLRRCMSKLKNTKAISKASQIALYL